MSTDPDPSSNMFEGSSKTLYIYVCIGNFYMFANFVYKKLLYVCKLCKRGWAAFLNIFFTPKLLRII